ncbi:MAG: hypothetical protein U0359_38930 [Byssovorax sp.]
MVLPRPAQAVEVNGGVGIGGVLAGILPRLALSPHVGLAWSTDGGFLFELHDVLAILPVGSALGVGVYNQTSAAVGYAWKDGALSAGPSLAIYRMPACGHKLCGRVVGLGPGGHAEGSYYFWGPLGLWIHANFAWMGGKSSVLPSGVAGMVVVGPVLRWRSG